MKNLSAKKSLSHILQEIGRNYQDLGTHPARNQNSFEYICQTIDRLAPDEIKNNLNKVNAYTALFYGYPLAPNRSGDIDHEETNGYNRLLDCYMNIKNLHKFNQKEIEYTKQLVIAETAKYIRNYGENTNPFLNILLKPIGKEIIKAECRTKLFGLFDRKTDLEIIVYSYFYEYN